MESKHLRYFLAVAEQGSVTRAAQKLGMAQPALSQSLSRMEADLGVKLVERTRRGATLTLAGESIVEDIREAIANIDRAAERAREVASGHAGTIQVGLVSSSLVDVLPRALRQLKKAEPGIKVVLREMSNADLALAVKAGGIDIALMHSPAMLDKGMREEVLMRDHLIAAVPTSMKFSNDKCISIAEMAQAGIVTYPHGHLPVFIGHILDTFRKHGQSVEIVQEANRTLTVLACVAAGMGIALLPSWIQALSLEGVRYCEMEDSSSFPTFDVSAIWLKRSTRSLADRFYAAASMRE